MSDHLEHAAQPVAPDGAGESAPDGPEIADATAGVLMIVRPVVDRATGRTETVTFRVEGRDAAPTEAELARLLGGPPAVVLRAPSRHRPDIVLTVYARADAKLVRQLPPSAVLVHPTGKRTIAVGALVILAHDGAGPTLATPLEIVDVQYHKVDALPYPLLRIRTDNPLVAVQQPIRA